MRAANPRRPLGRTLLVVGGAVVLSLLGLALIGSPSRPTPPPPAPAPVPHFVDVREGGEPRVVVVGAAGQQLPGTSNTSGYLMVNLEQGQIPTGASQALVLSDTRCEPDADGISHCLNDLDMGGVVVTVQHHHAMSEVPCLTPGETVALMSLAAYQGSE